MMGYLMIYNTYYRLGKQLIYNLRKRALKFMPRLLVSILTWPWCYHSYEVFVTHQSSPSICLIPNYGVS